MFPSTYGKSYLSGSSFVALEICESPSEVVSRVLFFKLASPSLLYILYIPLYILYILYVPFVKEITKEDHVPDNLEHSPIKKTKDHSSLRLDSPGDYIFLLPRKFQSFWDPVLTTPIKPHPKQPLHRGVRIEGGFNEWRSATHHRSSAIVTPCRSSTIWCLKNSQDSVIS